MKKILLTISLLLVFLIGYSQKMPQLFNGYLSNMAMTSQSSVVENGVTYNTFGFVGSFNNDLGQYDGSEVSTLNQDIFLAVTVDGFVYELKILSISGGSIITGVAIDYSNELSALPAGSAALYVKTPNTQFPASTAGLSVELREAIDNYFKILIDTKGNSCLKRVEYSVPHAFSVGDFLVVVSEGVFEEATTTQVPNAVVVDVENQLIFTYAVCGSFNVDEFSTLGKIQWLGISDGEYTHNLTNGDRYRMFEKWGSEITIDGPYPKPAVFAGENGITLTTLAGAKLFELGGELDKNTTIDGVSNYNLLFDNMVNFNVNAEGIVKIETSNTPLNKSTYLLNTEDYLELKSSVVTDASNAINNNIILSSNTGNLQILSDNTVGGILTTKSIVMSNPDDAIAIKNLNQNTGEYTQLSLYEDLISLKTPNVVSSTATTGQYLKLIDANTGEIEFADVVGGGGASALNDLTDVTLTTPVNDNVLKYSNGEWVNGTETDPLWSIDKPFYLGDVFLDNLASGQILVYDGSNWVNSNPAASNPIALNDITDVDITSIQTNDILQFNGTSWVNAQAQAGSGITAVTGTNGLTASDNGDNTYNVKLGGTLTDPTTTIDVNSRSLTLNTTTGSITISDGTDAFVNVANNIVTLKGNFFQNSGFVEFQEYGEGLNINNDPVYLAGFSNTGRFVEVEESSLPFTEVTQSNGLTVAQTGNVYDIKLGGTLTGPTTIEGGANLFQVNSTGSIVLQNNTNSFLTVGSSFTQIKGNITQNYGDVTFADYGEGTITGTLAKLAGFDASGRLIDVDPTMFNQPQSLEELTNVTITSPVNNQVLKYIDGVWVNAADAVGEVGSGVTSVTANSGLTQSGTANDPIIRLGGTLGISTSISGNNLYGFTVDNVTDLLLEANNVFLQTSAIINNTSTAGQVLKLVDPLNGNIEYSNDINFANTDLTISQNRKHTITSAGFVIDGTGDNLINITVDPALTVGEATDYNLISGKMGVFMDTNIDNILLYGDIVTSLGTVKFFDYGVGNKEEADLLVEASPYILGVATNGDVIEVPKTSLGATNLNGLTDINLTAPTEGQILTYSATATEWVNTDLPTLDPASINIQDLGNVTISGVKDAQFLQYDSGTQQWINTEPVFPTNQTLTVTDATAELSISDGNTVDLSEAIDQQVATLLQAGSNISLSYDNIANTLTINASGTINDLSNITFVDNTSDAVSNVLQYNPEYETLVFGSGVNNTPVHIGQDLFWFVKNQTGSPIAKGVPVYVTGTDGNSGRKTVAPMIANGTINAKFFLGVTAEAIADGSDGLVSVFGSIRGVDLSGFSANDVLYVSPTVAGTFVTDEPDAPQLKLPVGYVVNNVANGTISVRVTNGSYLSESHDVQIAGATTGEVLKYDGTKWVDGTDLVDDADADPNNEIQTISLDGNNLTLSDNGGTVTLPSYSVVNGLTASGNTFELGGTLTKNTQVYIPSANILYLGTTGVTPSTGIQIEPGTNQVRVYNNFYLNNYGTGGKISSGTSGLNPYAYLLGVSSQGYIMEVDPTSLGSGIALGDLSAVTASPGTTSLTYDNSTGAFTYTPPDLSGYLTAEVDGSTTNEIQTLSISGGTSLSISGGNTVTLPSYINESTTASNGLTEVGNDIQLGGNLTGNVNIDGLSQRSFNLSNLSQFILSVIPGGANINISGPGITFSVGSGSIFNSTNNFSAGSETGKLLNFADGTLKMDGYGDGNKEYSDFEGTRYAPGTNQPQYLAAFAGEGTVIEYPISSIGGGIDLTDLSVTTNSPGTSSLTYNNTTGQFTFTPPDLSGYVNNITSVSNGLTLSSGALTLGGNFTSDISINSFTAGADFSVTTQGGGISLNGQGTTSLSLGSTSGVATLTGVGSLNLASSGNIAIGEGSGNDMILNSAGTLSILRYGEGIKEAGDLSKTASSYLAGFATDGTLIDVPISSIGGGVTSASQGLTLSSGVLKLGGTITENIGIALNPSGTTFDVWNTDYEVGFKVRPSLRLIEIGGGATIGGVVFNGYGLGSKKIDGQISLQNQNASDFVAAFSTNGVFYEIPLINKITTETANTSVSIDFLEYYQRIIRFDLASLSAPMVMTFSNPVDGAIYTLHFTGATGKSVTFPTNCVAEDGVTQMGTVALTTAGRMFTMYYDATTSTYYVK